MVSDMAQVVSSYTPRKICMYQFILLDKTDGRTWHVQWGEKAERWIRRID